MSVLTSVMRATCFAYFILLHVVTCVWIMCGEMVVVMPLGMLSNSHTLEENVTAVNGKCPVVSEEISTVPADSSATLILCCPF